MKRKATSLTTLVSFCIALALAAFVGGCPASPPTPGDGGGKDDTIQPPPKLECTKGTACITIGSPNARGCEILLSTNVDIETPTVSFHEGVVGTSMQSGKKIAVGIVAKTNESLAEGDAKIVIKLTDGLSELNVEKTICYDVNGAVIDKATVKVTKP